MRYLLLKRCVDHCKFCNVFMRREIKVGCRGFLKHGTNIIIMSIFIIEHVKQILCECFFPLSNLETGVVQF